MVGELVSTPFDFSKPLWQVHLITGITFPNSRVRASVAEGSGVGKVGSALLIRLHHCITDGQGAIRLLLTLTSLEQQGNTEEGCGVKISATEKENMLKSQYGKHKPKNEKKMEVNESKVDKLEEASERKKNPGQGLASLIADIFMLPFRLFLFLLGLLIMGMNYFYIVATTRQSFLCTSGSAKHVAWSASVSLNDVKKIKNALGCTVNDVLVSCLCGSIQTYLETHPPKSPRTPEKNVLCGIPVSVRKWDDWTLGNKVVIANLWLPVDRTSPMDRLNEIKTRMDALKKAPDVIVSYYCMKLYTLIPKFLRSEWLLQRYMTRSHCLFTNVPGPREPILFGGKRVTEYLVSFYVV